MHSVLAVMPDPDPSVFLAAGSSAAATTPADVARLIDEHQPLLRAWLRLQVGGGADVDDLAQDVAVGLWEAAAAYDHQRPFAAWMIGFARNHVLRWRDRRARDRRLLPIDEDAHRSLTDAAVDLPTGDQFRGALDLCLGDIDAGGADLLRWRFADDLRLEDIAVRARISVATACRRLARLLRLLEECVRRRVEGRA